VKTRTITVLLVSACAVALALALAGCGGASVSTVSTTLAVDPEDQELSFAGAVGEKYDVTVDGAPVSITRYLVTYVADPIQMAAEAAGKSGSAQTAADAYARQKMYIYVPDTSAGGPDAAIILRVENSGWMSTPVLDILPAGGKYVSDSDTDAIGAALKAGYVIVRAGTRGRGLTAADGTYPGHAPAVVVDAKAAIRYLKLNDAVMPGSADKIVITGMSGGGGLSTAVAASGNSPEYYPYLQEIGAAGIDADGNSTLKDDVFATIAYCPITDLDHADIAYEWQYGATRLALGEMTGEAKTVSEELAAEYPAYLASLGLKLEDGTPLTAETMPGAIEALAKAGAERAMASGVTVTDLGEEWKFGDKSLTNDWLDVDNDANTVVNIDYAKYLEFVATMNPPKSPPAFDKFGTPLEGGMNESNLSGTETEEYSHWLGWSWDNDSISGNSVGMDDTNMDFDQFIATDAGKSVIEQMHMVNPIPYLISETEGDSAPYWYVRHGMRDRDTSFAVEVTLFYAIQNDPTVKDANYALAYMQPHSGEYDVQEAYAWLAGVLGATK
jgi:hypothetical protein